MGEQGTVKICKRAKTPSILQMEMVECGAASLAMVLAYHRLYVPLEKLRVECGVTRDGVRASNIVKAARKYGFEAKGYRMEPEALKSMTGPMIIHWNFNHFVVLEGFHPTKDRVYLNDPGSGRRTITFEEFDLSFTGVVLTFTPNESFKAGGEKSSMMGSLLVRINAARTPLALLIIAGLLLVIPGIVIPTFSQLFIDEVMLAGRTDWLRPLLWFMGATVLVNGLLHWIQQKYLRRMEVKLALVGASSFFWHILRLPILFFQQRSAGDISDRMGNNDKVAAFLSRELSTNVINLVTVVFYLVIMSQYNILLTVISIVLAGCNVAYFFYSSGKVEAVNSKTMQDSGKLYGTSVSGLYIIETLKATGSESGFFSKWAGYHAKVLNGQQKLGALSQVLQALPNLLSQMAEMFVLVVGGLEILKGNLTVGSLIAFQGLLGNFMNPIAQLTQMGMSIKQLKSDMNRLDDVMKYDVDAYADPDRDNTSSEKNEEDYRKLDGYIEVKDLSFGYNLLEPPLIDNFNLTLRPGSRVALVGASGSGKSTVTKILTGINRQWGGQILLDGVEKDDLPRNVLTNSIAVVDQDISMFDATILDNLTMWDATITEQDVIKAAKDACIHDDINTRPGGYRAMVSEGGSNFSGGQRQRMEIARALAGNPTILIMDEATSALDVTTEQIVNDNIRRRGCTCIVVAHRLSTIRDCDEIIVMHKGKIVQRGTHEEMKNVQGPYAELIKTAV